ncbi:sigma-54 interaction domain-containing protein [Alkalicoccus luteus]|uniref:Sigma 54-interacting transcriptional regulator n=1 Tax=Alkalicoccus luteus TaxID=1237094 RepID=A0A969TW43_9BACI|nr:sigma 54-interacting transcriptional regulator [Alkalicoccus luteus]NJP38676.1 sigma 54-interacting transcriptional regulator [Alkalicoccus luteus]
MLGLIAGSRKTERALYSQLDQLLGDFLSIRSCALDEVPVPEWLPQADLLVFSSDSVRKEWERTIPNNRTPAITGIRTIDPEAINVLLHIAPGRVLIVNDDAQSIRETAESMYQLGLTHLIPVALETSRLYYDGIDTAVTPGEPEKCPPSISTMVDIGVRPFSMKTLLDIVASFKLPLASQISERYLQTIVRLQRRLLEEEEQTSSLMSHYHDLLDQVDDAILAVDHSGLITAANKRMAAFCGMQETTLLGRSAADVLTATPAGEFLTSDNSRQTVSGEDDEYVLYKTDTGSGTIMTMKSVETAFEVEQTAKRAKQDGLRPQYTLDDIIARDPEMVRAKEAARKMAASLHPVILQGETGVGKELFAHAVHHNSPVWQGPFFAVNAGAMTESLLLSELFGYEEGTFTGAQKGGRRGLFELASGGTLFLDEIGDLSPNVQGQLLRVLQEGEIRRVGGSRNIPVDVRIVTATNKVLDQEVEQGRFRSDLVYRLRVLPLTIPPLRERKEDLPLLVEAFLPEGKRLSKAALEALTSYSWPGNIRELKSCLAYAVTLGGDVISTNDLPATVLTRPASSMTPDHLRILDSLRDGTRKSLKQLEQEASPLTLQQIRRLVNELDREGLIQKGRGRIGSQITHAGMAVYD